MRKIKLVCFKKWKEKKTNNDKFLIARFFHLCKERKTNSCWENCLKDGQITKLWPDSSQIFFIYLIDTLPSLEAPFYLKKPASYSSTPWLVMRFPWNVTHCFFLYTFITLGLLSFYLSQVYNEMNRQVMDAILAMVLSIFDLIIFQICHIYQSIIIIDWIYNFRIHFFFLMNFFIFFITYLDWSETSRKAYWWQIV
jgi:hypothetical protein